MTLRKPTVAAIAAIAALVGGMSVAESASAQNWRGRGGGTNFSFGFSTGPGYGYGYGPGFYGGQRFYGGRGYGYGWNNRGFYPRPGRYYGPPGWRGGGRFRACDRWVWDGWRQTYVLVRGRC